MFLVKTIEKVTLIIGIFHTIFCISVLSGVLCIYPPGQNGCDLAGVDQYGTNNNKSQTIVRAGDKCRVHCPSGRYGEGIEGECCWKARSQGQAAHDDAQMGVKWQEEGSKAALVMKQYQNKKKRAEIVPEEQNSRVIGFRPSLRFSPHIEDQTKLSRVTSQGQRHQV